MENEQKVEKEVVPNEATEKPETESQAPSPEKDPVKVELEAVERTKKSKLEKLEFTQQRIAEQIAQEKAKSGIHEVDEDRPLTLKEYNELRKTESLETAMNLAEQIEDENERKLTKHYLEDVIKPSGDPKEDLRIARLMVNSVKHQQIAEETGRTTKAKPYSSSPSAPAKEKTSTELTKEEEAIARGFNLSPEEVLKARTAE